LLRYPIMRRKSISSSSSASPVPTAAPRAAAVAPLDALDALPLALAALALPVSRVLDALPAAREPLPLLAIGVAVLGAVAALPLLVRGVALRGWYAAFSLFAFTSAIDGLMAATAFGLTSVSAFYLEAGEAYLGTTHGALINAWDATAHLACYVVFAAAARRGGAAMRASWLAPLTFAWAGSVLHSLAVMLPGVFVGVHGATVKPAILLNALYVAVPVGFAAAAAAAAPPPPPRRAAAGGAPADAVLAALLLAAAALAAARAVALASVSGAGAALLAAEPYLSDASAFPRVTAVLLAAGVAPVLAASALALAHRAVSARGGAGAAWLRDNRLLLCYVAGSVAQSQGAYALGSAVDFPATRSAAFFAGNVLLFAGVPATVALREAF